jgi:hypothetical protein
MKKAFLLIAVSALLVTLGFAQTPNAGGNTEQANVKGCLGGSDGNYTVTEDGTGQIFKISTSAVDLKLHLGHDVQLTGHKASVSSGAADSGIAVTALNMVSEHCAAAAAAPLATIAPTATVIAPTPTTAAPSPTASTPTADAAAAAAAPAAAAAAAPAAAAAAAPAAAAAAAPAAAAAAAPAAAAAAAPAAAAAVTVSPSSAPSITPAVDAAAPAATVTPSPAMASTPAVEPVVPAATVTPSSATPSTPAEAPVAPIASVNSYSDTLSPDANATQPKRQSAHTRKHSAAQAEAAEPAATVTPSPDTVNPTAVVAATPAPTASPSTQAASTSAAAVPTPIAAHKGSSLWLLILVAVLVVVLGTLVPLLGRWRKRKMLEKTGKQNLSFTKEASTDEDKPEPRKVA